MPHILNTTFTIYVVCKTEKLLVILSVHDVELWLQMQRWSCVSTLQRKFQKTLLKVAVLDHWSLPGPLDGPWIVVDTTKFCMLIVDLANILGEWEGLITCDYTPQITRKYSKLHLFQIIWSSYLVSDYILVFVQAYFEHAYTFLCHEFLCHLIFVANKALPTLKVIGYQYIADPLEGPELFLK